MTHKKPLIKLDTITRLHEDIGYDKPKHPLITLIDYAKVKPVVPLNEVQIQTGLYSISLKNKCFGEMRYGRQTYDFQEGSLVFMAPGQIMSFEGEPDTQVERYGWGVYLHPDLIRKYPLARKMRGYTFFSYDTHEALHVSNQEKHIITGVAQSIEHEFSQNLDDYSNDLIVSHLELLLGYCKRFYGRQFITRSHANKDLVVRFEEFLGSYFDSGRAEKEGLPTVKYSAQQMGYSTNYLSDLLKKETGKNTQEHIHTFVIERAKNQLLGSRESISQIAYALGFEYPQHFSKLFKNKTGMSPAEYRR